MLNLWQKLVPNVGPADHLLSYELCYTTCYPTGVTCYQLLRASQERAGKTVSVFILANLWSVCWIVLDCLSASGATGEQVQITGQELWKKQPQGDAFQGHGCLPVVDLPIWRRIRDCRLIFHSRLPHGWPSSLGGGLLWLNWCEFPAGTQAVPSHRLRHMMTGVQQTVRKHGGNKLHRIWKYSVSTDRWCICTALLRVHQPSLELSNIWHVPCWQYRH